MDTPQKALVVDDEECVCSVICALLAENGYQTKGARDGFLALELLDEFNPDIIFTDLNMPRMSGLELIARLKDRTPDTPIVVVSGTGDMQSAIEAIRRGAWEYIIKPISSDTLYHVTNRALERARLINENRLYQEHLEEMVMERTKELRDSEIRYRTLFDTANDAIVLIQSGVITSCNAITGELFGIKAEEMAGRTILSFSPDKQQNDNDSAGMSARYEQLALEGTPQCYEWRFLRADGVILEAEISLNRLILQGEPHLLAIMRDVTDRKKAAAALLENACIKHELNMAYDIQCSLLPEAPPAIQGLQVACSCSPAASVGGDYYDFFSVSPDMLDIVIADVSGHSIGSALLMSEARTVLHAKARVERPPAQLLTALNELMHQDLCRAELQMSAFAVRIYLQEQMMAYANAGHTRPLLFRHVSGEIEQLDSEGILIGVTLELKFEEQRCRVVPGDILLLYTDGLVDAENVNREFFGIERLSALLATRRGETPQEIITAIYQELDSFTESLPRTDDVSLVVIKICDTQETRGALPKEC